MSSLGQEWESQLLEEGIVLVTSFLDGRLKGDQFLVDGLQIDLVFAFVCADGAGNIEIEIIFLISSMDALRA